MTETEVKVPTISWRMEIRRLRWITRHVDRLTPVSIRWLRSWLIEDFTDEGLRRG